MNVFILTAEDLIGLYSVTGDEVVGALASINSATVSVIVRSRTLGHYAFGVSFVNVGNVDIMLTFELELLGLDAGVLIVEHFVGALGLPHCDHQAGQLVIC